MHIFPGHLSKTYLWKLTSRHNLDFSMCKKVLPIVIFYWLGCNPARTLMNASELIWTPSTWAWGYMDWSSFNPVYLEASESKLTYIHCKNTFEKTDLVIFWVTRTTWIYLFLFRHLHAKQISVYFPYKLTINANGYIR